MPKLSIIIANYNTREILRDCLSSLEDKYDNKEVVVVDLESPDDSARMVKEEFPWVKLIETKNKGLSWGCNRGMEAASGEYLLFLGADAFPEKGTLERMVKYMEEHEDVGASTCKLVLRDGSLDMDAHRGFPTPWTSITKFTGLYKLFPKSKLFNLYFLGWKDMNKPHEIDLAITHFLLIRKKVFDEIGNWDENFFIYGEDVDICYRIKQARWKIMYLPQWKALHYKGVSVGVRKESQDLTKATYGQKVRALNETTCAMKTFVNKHYKDKYPKLLITLMLMGTLVLNKLRIFRLFLREKFSFEKNIPKKIGIDARFYGKAGPGRYAKNIVKHLEKIDKKNKYVVFLRKEGFEQYYPESPNFEKVLADYPWYSFDEQIRFLFRAITERLDLLYVPHFNIPIFYPGKIVTAIPDMTMHLYSTERGTTLPRPYFKLKKIVYKFVFWWAVVKSVRVIVPSKSAIDDFVKAFPSVVGSKFVLAYEGLDPDFRRDVVNTEKVLKKYGVKKPFLLHVGSMYEHKNISGLIEMFKILRDKYDFKGQLVLISKKDKFSEKIYRKVKNESLNNIIFPAFLSKEDSDITVTDEEIIALRKEAELYVFASFKEGFSLTPLEGMAVGLPTVVSRIPCHEEVYGDSVMYFDPKDPVDMANNVNKMLTDESLKAHFVEKGYELVGKYDWTETAKITLAVFKYALNYR